MTTVISLIEQYLDEPSARLAKRVESGKVPWSQLYEFTEAHKAYERSQRIDPVPPGILRPYIPIHASRSRFYTGGIEFDYHHFLNGPERALASLGALKQHLLYCHALAVENPLVYFLDSVVESRDSQQTRTALANYLRFIVAVRELVESGVLILVEPHFWDTSDEYADARLDSGLRRRAHEAIMQADLSEYPTSGGELPGDVRRRLLVGAIGDAIAISLAAAEYHHLDLYVPFRFFLPGFAALSPDVPELPRVRPQELVSALVPQLDSLSLNDVVAVRRDEEAFEQWRVYLKNAVGAVSEGFDPSEPQANAQLLREARAELSIGQGIVEQRVKSSSALAKAKEGTRDFTLGALATATLAPFVGGVSAVALGAAALKSTGAVAWQYAKSRKASATRDRALLHHFLVFEPPRSASDRA
jgi:hypothetical protein